MPQDPLGQFKPLLSVTVSVQTKVFTVAPLASLYLNPPDQSSWEGLLHEPDGWWDKPDQVYWVRFLVSSLVLVSFFSGLVFLCVNDLIRRTFGKRMQT